MNEIKLPKIHVNAEFQRLWWTNVRWGLIAGVVLIFMLFLFAKPEWRDWDRHLKDMGFMAMMLSALAGYILLERSLKQDVSANAFDQLRMSSLSVWQMAWSRMVVSPLMAWVVFGLGWAAVLVGEKISNSTTWNEAILLLSLPFFAWGVACLVLANALPTPRDNRHWNGSVVQLILLYISGMVWLADWGTAIREIKVLDDVYFDLIQQFTGINMAISFVIFAAMASVFVWARMANVLHLKRVDKIYVILAVCSPILTFWSWETGLTAMAATGVIYGALTLISLVTQGVKCHRFRLPVWILTAPLGLVAAMMLPSEDVIWLWLQMVGLALLAWVGSRLRLGVNSVTVALAAYLLGHALWAVFN